MRYDVARVLHTVDGSIRIPAGTKAVQCNGGNCDEWVYFVEPVKEGDKKRCVSIAEYYNGFGGRIKGIAPTATEDGAGIDHHANCPDAKQFTRRKNDRI